MNVKYVALWGGKGGRLKKIFVSKENWFQIQVVRPLVDWHKGVWFPHSTPKFSFMIWLAMQNRFSYGR